VFFQDADLVPLHAPVISAPDRHQRAGEHQRPVLPILLLLLRGPLEGQEYPVIA